MCDSTVSVRAVRSSLSASMMRCDATSESSLRCGRATYSLSHVHTHLLTYARSHELTHRAASAHESMRPMIEATVTVASKQFHRSWTSSRYVTTL